MDVTVVKGWELYALELFIERLTELVEAVEKLMEKEPERFIHHPIYKLLEDVMDSIYDRVPANPDSPDFRLGKTMSKDYTHWRRVKKGLPNRYRLFFRFNSKTPKSIIYAWLNDNKTLRKEGSKTDVYAVFQKMLSNGKVPDSWDDLVANATSEGLEKPA